MLEYHHIEPSLKSFHIYSAILNGAKLSVVKKEIAKCMVLCSNHHRLFHKGVLYRDEQILYDLYVYIKYENKDWSEIENLDFLLDSLNNNQIEFINKFYNQNFKLKGD